MDFARRRDVDHRLIHGVRGWTGSRRFVLVSPPPSEARSFFWLPFVSSRRARVLGSWLAGPGCGFSEEPMSGVRSVALECRVVPECPPGPA